jgi:hypothetical protein
MELPRALSLLWIIVLAGCASPRYPVSGLRPVYPPPGQPGSFVAVASHTPTLSWDGFPRPEDVARDPRLAGLAGVTYDLRIWLVGDRRGVWVYPGVLVYSRDGLPSPQHTLAVPLEGRREYVWTVRAAFELDHQPRVTQWGVLAPPGFANLLPLGIVSPFYYRLRSPSG